MWAIGIAAVVVRLAVAVVTGGLWSPELNEYDAIARNMLRGAGFSYSHIGVVYYSYAPPLYAWLSAGSYWLTGSIAPVMALQVLAGGVLASVAAGIAHRLFGGWIAGAVAGTLVVFHPGLVVYSATRAHPLTFDALFFALALLQAFRLVERPTTRRAVTFGLIVGVGTLSRATIVIFLPIVGLGLLFVTPRPLWAAAIRSVVVAGLCATAAVAPWTIRNSLLHGRFVFLLTTDSDDFWRGNNPYATGHSYIDAGRIVLSALPEAERRDLERQPNELAQREWFAARARAFIVENPGAFIRLTLSKFFYFWWFAPQTGVLYPRSWLRIYMAYYAGVVLLAAIGVWTLWHVRNQTKVLGILMGAFLIGLSGLQSLYYVEGRHRWAVESMILALSGGGMAALVERRRGRAAGS